MDLSPPVPNVMKNVLVIKNVLEETVLKNAIATQMRIASEIPIHLNQFVFAKMVVLLPLAMNVSAMPKMKPVFTQVQEATSVFAKMVLGTYALNVTQKSAIPLGSAE